LDERGVEFERFFKVGLGGVRVAQQESAKLAARSDESAFTQIPMPSSLSVIRNDAPPLT
jgi:hypothetical protein